MKLNIHLLAGLIIIAFGVLLELFIQMDTAASMHMCEAKHSHNVCFSALNH
jgi:hypothetical protein